MINLEDYKNLNENERQALELQEWSEHDQSDFEAMKNDFIQEQQKIIEEKFNMNQDIREIDVIVNSVGLENKDDLLEVEQETKILENIRDIDREAKTLPMEDFLDDFELNEDEMNPEEFLLRKKIHEADKMASRAARYRREVETAVPTGEKVLVAESPEEKVLYEKAARVVGFINDLNEDLDRNGLSFDQIQEFQYSMVDEERVIYETFKTKVENNESWAMFDDLEKNNPNQLLDSLMSMKESGIKNHLISNLLENPQISYQKAFEAGKNFLPKIGHVIDRKILQSKMDSIEVFPINEVMSIWKQDPRLFKFGDSSYRNNTLFKKATTYLDEYIQKADKVAISEYLDSLEAVEVAVKRDLGYQMIPSLFDQNNFGSSDKKAILRGEMPQWIFDRYKHYIKKSPLLALVPEDCFSREDLTKFISKGDISFKTLNVLLEKTGITFTSLDTGSKRDLALLGDFEIRSLFEVSDIEEILQFKYTPPQNFPPEKVLQLKPLFISSMFRADIYQMSDIRDLERVLGVIPADLDEDLKARVIMCNPGDLDTYKFFSSEDIVRVITNQKYYLNPSKVPREIFEKYNKLFSHHIKNELLGQGTVTYDFLKEKSFRDNVFEEVNKELGSKSIGQEKISNIKNIEASFDVGDARERIPEEVRIVIERFEQNYGSKGKGLVSLAIAAYGIESPEALVRKLESIESILNKYDHDAIPEGARVSMGIEYEVTKSISDIYAESSAFGYKKDIELVSRSSNIAQGRDAVHEIALRPNFNPYMMLAEVKLLQDAGFIDFNFEKYKDAPRGYHLSLVGERGLSVGENIYFLHNMLTMTQLSGVTAGNMVSTSKGVHKKNFELIGIQHQRGDRCEIKGMATDSVEQFEKAVITSHHAGIAIQVYNKYFSNGTLNEPFASDQEREIARAWMDLKQEIMDAVSDHNESFVDSEFNGFLLDKNGEYHDTGEHIDIMRNKSLFSAEYLSSQSFRDKILISPKYLFENQSPEFVNALTNTVNIFLKPPQGNENSPVNARAVLDTVKQSGYGDIVDGRPQDSLFEKDGNIRDGYYTIQGASEEMIIHKSQIILNRFNTKMEALLAPGMKNHVLKDELIHA